MSGPMDRRGVLRFGALASVGLLAGGASSAPDAAEASEEAAGHGEMTAEKALARLKHGNDRFVGGNAVHPDQTRARRGELAAAQQPIATVLSCVDSRVPPELVFDEGLGNLFVTRSAGQVVDRAILGSIQFGVHELHIPLLVVLGHSRCGAVKATMEAVEKKSPASGTDIDVLVAAISPAVEEAKSTQPADLLGASVGVNVDNIVRNLRAAPVLSAAIAEQKLEVVGAVYDLATGKVAWR